MDILAAAFSDLRPLSRTKRNRRKLSPHQLITLYQAASMGVPINDIADATGLSRHRIRAAVSFQDRNLKKEQRQRLQLRRIIGQ